MQSTRRQSRWSRRSPPVAGGLCLLLIGVQVLGLTHLLLERHGMCWEHGTVTELGRGDSVAGAPEEVAGPLGLHSGQSAAVEDVDDHHCPVQAARRDWGNPPGVAELALVVGSLVCAVGPGDASSRADDTLLLRAPKQSPPGSA